MAAYRPPSASSLSHKETSVRARTRTENAIINVFTFGEIKISASGYIGMSIGRFPGRVLERQLAISHRTTQSVGSALRDLDTSGRSLAGPAFRAARSDAYLRDIRRGKVSEQVSPRASKQASEMRNRSWEYLITEMRSRVTYRCTGRQQSRGRIYDGGAGCPVTWGPIFNTGDELHMFVHKHAGGRSEFSTRPNSCALVKYRS